MPLLAKLFTFLHYGCYKDFAPTELTSLRIGRDPHDRLVFVLRCNLDVLRSCRSR
jgi:hypothetical protein